METKINIAELLKDCPQGMELDCIIFNNPVKYESANDDGSYPISIRTEEGELFYLNKYGCVYDRFDSKCAIFPKGKTTWEGFVPPCKFKDGDIITDSLGTCIFKGEVEGEFEGCVNYYCGISDGCFSIKDDKRNPCGHYGFIVNYRLSTEEEKQQLFDVIKENGYKWNEETKTLEKLVEPKFKVGDRIKQIGSPRCYIIKTIEFDRYVLNNNQFIRFVDEHIYELVPNKFDITTLKPFESRVLVRQNNSGIWGIDFFGFYNEGYYHTTGNCIYVQCVPYEQNEHLLGKTDDCDEYYKTW
jgi:hypothetical protein